MLPQFGYSLHVLKFLMRLIATHHFFQFLLTEIKKSISSKIKKQPLEVFCAKRCA